MIVTELGDRIEQLKNECPTEWSPQKKEVDNAHVNMRSKYEETMDAIGKAAPLFRIGLTYRLHGLYH